MLMFEFFILIVRRSGEGTVIHALRAKPCQQVRGVDCNYAHPEPNPAKIVSIKERSPNPTQKP